MLVHYGKADTSRRGTILLICRRKLVGKVVPIVQTVEGQHGTLLPCSNRPFSREQASSESFA